MFKFILGGKGEWGLALWAISSLGERGGEDGLSTEILGIWGRGRLKSTWTEEVFNAFNMIQ